jgi:hypothetical protein
MKKFIVILVLFLGCTNINASLKYLIETEKSVDLIKLINIEIGKTNTIFPISGTKTDFVFEVNKIDPIFFRISKQFKN